jgi:hypothetical protein
MTLLQAWGSAMLGACVLLSTGEPLVPDRPDVSNGTATVPPAAVQVEAGVEIASAPRRHARPTTTPATALRIGVNARAELRLFEGDPIGWAVAGVGADPRVGFGAKVRLHDGHPDRLVPSLGLLPLVVSRRPAGAWRGDPPTLAFVVLASQPITPRLALDLNAGPRFDPAESRRRALAAMLSASLGYSAHDRVMLFVEAYGVAASRTVAAFGADGGVLVTVTPELALDLAARTELLGDMSIGLMFGVTGLYEGPRPTNRRERRNPTPGRGRSFPREQRMLAVRRTVLARESTRLFA